MPRKDQGNTRWILGIEDGEPVPEKDRKEYERLKKKAEKALALPLVIPPEDIEMLRKIIWG